MKSRALELLVYIHQLQQVSAVDEISKFQEPWQTQDGESRYKRGLIDLGGKALKWLFGIATDADLEKISTIVDRLQVDRRDVLHLLQKQVSVRNISAANIEKNREDIKLIVETMRNLTGETYALKLQLNNTSWSLWRSLVSVELIQISLRRVNVALSELQVEVMAFWQALNTAAQRKLSPYLITPSQLFQILQNITLKLPADRTLAVPLSSDSIFISYH